ncbi:tumor protein D52 isoform X1 [Lates japonicus]|uniref:Tumor protein D52 isoform X1 n=1 Tax=Lates japonicus TaxID=270547 RepID=A0AAD3N5H6_LATJO|nr:tumor protein D52 isoform X1 [Lates japonicus]
MEPLEEYHSPFDFEQGVNTSYLYLSPAYSDTPPSSPAVKTRVKGSCRFHGHQRFLSTEVTDGAAANVFCELMASTPLHLNLLLKYQTSAQQVSKAWKSTTTVTASCKNVSELKAAVM